jgi:CheY-like chemotaxis protein
MRESAVGNWHHFIDNIPAEKKTILVIDDDRDIVEVQKIFLEMEGFEVVTAGSGHQGLRILDDMKRPSLILLDVMLGDMSGTEFLNLLAKRNPEILEAVPVIFLTGMDEIPAAKVRGFIRKPFDNADFLNAVHHFIEMGTGHGR